MNYLKVLVKKKAVLDYFLMEFEYYNNQAEEFDRNVEPIAEEFLGEFKNILESRKSPIKIEDFRMISLYSNPTRASDSNSSICRFKSSTKNRYQGQERRSNGFF
ncbi:hypothetical protein B9Z55_020822 [Caenorhabditis nigoni]|uniref:Uncharacterized protein n=1 Tax=Caenorhabditis nigoni TaxID=1611254 RepID=A0A2G5TPG9_9PELO|nr:hypothetical protein B9Z55_020822 [Caenorhabditis nigoni]